MARSSRERSCMIEQFTRKRPPSFARGANPLVPENWVQDIEDILAALLCTDKQRWRSVRVLEEQRSDPIVMTWSRFREIFFERYFLATIRSVKASEFMYLTQGSMTVQQYATRFVELFWFTSYMVPDEDRKAGKFEEGLRQNLYEEVVGF
ncbi:uncharacterized protein LOC131163769 [Malania oleifera]|uniref:uncharacterized protein LOC131163769 n=1 Tax=Malania oleifera TaxID=397392 RepID=UPI0025ADDBA9|nr:uncharacterized protein LOC131163769 [Malania oleifera]